MKGANHSLSDLVFSFAFLFAFFLFARISNLAPASVGSFDPTKQTQCLWSTPDDIFSTDACLTGCGGMSAEQYFHVEFPSDVLLRFTAIHHLEALPIVIALRLWGCHWRGLSA